MTQEIKTKPNLPAADEIKELIKDGKIDHLLKVPWNYVLFEEDYDSILDSLLGIVAIEENQSSRFFLVIKRIFGAIFQGPANSECSHERTSHVLDQVHDCMRDMVSASLRSSKTIFRALKSSFPYHNVPPHMFFQFISNYLRSTDYFPEPEKTCIMKHVFEKLLFHDLKAKDHNGEIFQMDVLNEPIEESICLADSMVKILIEFIDDRVMDNGNYKLDDGWSMFEWMFPIFLEAQMSSKQTSASQYILFYLVHMDKVLLCTFLSRLWAYANDDGLSSINRCVAIYHLSSILTRSVAITLNETWDFVNKTGSWLQEYINEHDNNVDLGASLKNGTLMTVLTKHQYFYAVFQTFVVVLISSHNDLTPAVLKMLKLLNIQRTIDSKLNPLLVCTDHLLDSFSAICSSHLQVAACSVVQRRNKREFKTNSELLKDFQIWSPYDYVLSPLLSKFVGPYLRHGKGVERNSRIRVPSESNSFNFLHGSGSFDQSMNGIIQEDILNVISHLDA